MISVLSAHLRKRWPNAARLSNPIRTLGKRVADRAASVAQRGKAGGPVGVMGMLEADDAAGNGQ